MLKLFEPVNSASLSVSAANTSAEVTGLASTDNVIRLYWTGSQPLFVRWGKSAQTAVTTDMAIAPGAIESFFKADATRLAGISASTGTLYITTGNGHL